MTSHKFVSVAVLAAIFFAGTYVWVSSNEDAAVRKAIEDVHREGMPQLYEHERRMLEESDKSASPTGSSNPKEPLEPLRPVVSAMMFEHRVAQKLGNRHMTETFTPQRYNAAADGNYGRNDGILGSLQRVVEKAVSRRENSRKLEGATLTTSNTVPLKLEVNWDQLHLASAKPFKTCFNAGDWYYTGPEYVTDSDIPSAPTCSPPSVSTTPCWGKCQPDDVITEELRAHFKESVDNAVDKLEAALRVPKMSGKLKLQKSQGTYTSMYSGTWGWDTSSQRCGADTFYLCGASSPDSYCGGGVDANAVVYLTYNPVMNGGATGGPCEFDQYGRPITMIYNMRVDLAAGLRAINSRKAQLSDADFKELKENRYTSLSVHEIIHGLGFTVQMFQRSGIVELKNVYTTTGAAKQKDDALWHFNPSTRVSTLAKVHFDCQDDSKWNGLPLMGSAETGRDSHHNSFILVEDVISYGHVGRLTPFGLAPLEDMGLYLVDYSKTEYVDYGAYRGCEFIATRCRERNKMMDQEYVATDQKECNRNFAAESYTARTAFSRCAPDGCGMKSTCHPECIVQIGSNADKYKKYRPLMNGTGALLGPPRMAPEKEGLSSFLNSELMYIVIPLVASFIVSIVMSMISKCLFGTEERKIRSSHFISALFVLLGAALCGVGVYILGNDDVYGNLLSKAANIALICFGVAILLQGVLQWKAAVSPSRFYIFSASFVSVLFLIVQIVAALLLLFYLHSLDGIENSAIGGGKWDGKLGSDALMEVENYVCESYRNCCRDPRLASEGTGVGAVTEDPVVVNGTRLDSSVNATNGTTSLDSGVCLTAHDGDINTGILDVSDPSRPKFCESISGTPSSKTGQFKGMAKAACKVLDEHVIGFDQEECQAEFCSTGVKGYQQFVDLMVAAVRRNSMAMGGLLLFAVSIQIIQLVVLNALYKKHHKQKLYEENKIEIKSFPNNAV